MSNTLQLLEEKLQLLRQEYLHQLPERLALFEGWATQSRAGGLDASARAELQRAAHQLAGTATSYGFPSLTHTARALEETLIDHPQADITALLDAVLAAFHDALQQAAPAQAHTITSSLSAAPRPAILLVDDDPLMHRMLQKLLQEEAHIHTATSAREAARILETTSPALLILDQQLEGETTGLALLQQMRATPSLQHIPALLLTATHNPDICHQAREAGAAATLQKPLDPIAGLAAIRQHLRPGATPVDNSC